uniref:Uncharacterized protein n=1 Tax=Anguilla anguilla TaxID=7936 RepID=A0A0E9T8D4_ANGAN
MGVNCIKLHRVIKFIYQIKPHKTEKNKENGKGCHCMTLPVWQVHR